MLPADDSDVLLAEITQNCLTDLWFQQDGATCYTARETMTLLRSKFEDRSISQLASTFLRFDTARLFPLGLRQE